jgi:class 3 adenylate cyclase
MRCSKCGVENLEGLKFCNECGTALTAVCVSCGFGNQPTAKFCGQCGTSLERSVPDYVAEPLAKLAGERRHLTVMFCDLVGSTEMASHLDPEEWRAVVADYHHASTKVVERFGGSVAQYLGDGVLAYFGYPEAHDNDAERAVRAGLAILDAISKLNEHRTHPKLAARVGIDSGAVVVGAGAGGDADVFGDTPNIAARVQSAAEPGTVAITDAVHRLISGLFVVEDKGGRRSRGLNGQSSFIG